MVVGSSPTVVAGRVVRQDFQSSPSHRGRVRLVVDVWMCGCVDVWMGRYGCLDGRVGGLACGGGVDGQVGGVCVGVCGRASRVPESCACFPSHQCFFFALLAPPASLGRRPATVSRAAALSERSSCVAPKGHGGCEAAKPVAALFHLTASQAPPEADGNSAANGTGKYSETTEVSKKSKTTLCPGSCNSSCASRTTTFAAYKAVFP